MFDLPYHLGLLNLYEPASSDRNAAYCKAHYALWLCKELLRVKDYASWTSGGQRVYLSVETILRCTARTADERAEESRPRLFTVSTIVASFLISQALVVILLVCR